MNDKEKIALLRGVLEKHHQWMQYRGEYQASTMMPMFKQTVRALGATADDPASAAAAPTPPTLLGVYDGCR